MRRILSVTILILTSLLFHSCEDVFISTSQTLEEIRNNANIPEPAKIILGGDIWFNFDGINHESLIVLNGQGHYMDYALDRNSYGVYGDAAGYSGVRALELTPSYLYVGGEMGGYDSSNGSPSNNNPAFQMLLRFSVSNGAFVHDSSYSPFNGASKSAVRSLELVGGGNLAVGGEFSTPFNPVFTILNNSGAQVSLTYPSFVSGSPPETINQMLYFADSALLFAAGKFDTVSSVGGYQGLALINTSSGSAYSPATLLDDVATEFTEIRDFLLTENQEMYVVGVNGGTGVFRKYVYNGTNYSPDNTFNTNFNTERNRDTDGMPASFMSVNAVASNGNGLFIAGNFTNVEDSNGNSHVNVLRISSDGAVDPLFNPALQSSSQGVLAMECQKNGKIIIGGEIFNINGESVNGYVRLRPNGYVDYEFERYGIPGQQNVPTIYAIAIEEEPQQEK